MKVFTRIGLLCTTTALLKKAASLSSNPKERSRLAGGTGTQNAIASSTNSMSNNRMKEAVTSLDGASMAHQCKFCNSRFASRNELFRHVRADPTCFKLAGGETDYQDQKVLTRFTLALGFAYYGGTPTSAEQDIDEKIGSQPQPEASIAGKIVGDAVLSAVDEFCAQKFSWYARDGDDTTNDDDDSVSSSSSAHRVEFRSATQATVARGRHYSVAQERGCAAATDFMTLNIRAPAGLASLGPKETREFLDFVLRNVSQNMVSSASSHGVVVRFHSCKLMDPKIPFHAEQKCTQRIYRYMLPLRWLPDGQVLEEWWRTRVGDGKGCRNGYPRLEDWMQAQQKEQPIHLSRSGNVPSARSLIDLKKVLRSMESERVHWGLSKEEVEEMAGTGSRLASGRFGSLGHKVRRPFHNFADPMLKGDASPNQEPVWRVVDRARIVDFIVTDDCVDAVVEIRGDEFVHQQVRRMIGTAIAIIHGWLPSDAIDTLLRSDILLETPVAPEGRMYLAEPRFHFDEMRDAGKRLFESEKEGMVATSFDSLSSASPSSFVQRALRAQLATESVKVKEASWLQSMTTDGESTRKLQQDFRSATGATAEINRETTEAPEVYVETLDHLRSLVSTGCWPSTSSARADVISNLELENKQGSFTVVNPDFRGGLYKEGIGTFSLPLGNGRFPNLVKAVFDLELALSKNCNLNRTASSHCAINCNAQFTPHVDSGRGAGQSLSMIVGLGDYGGGELAVEGELHGIRYQPLEFDGWKLRHWTKPFEGERFSLVWFTPEVKA